MQAGDVLSQQLRDANDKLWSALGRVRRLAAECEQLDRNVDILRRQVIALGHRPLVHRDDHVDAVDVPPVILAPEASVIVKPETVFLRPKQRNGSPMRTLSVMMGPDGKAAIVGSRSVADSSWNLSGMTEDELNDLAVAIDAQRARGLGVRP